jgi:hypothetical protein
MLDAGFERRCLGRSAKHGGPDVEGNAHRQKREINSSPRDNAALDRVLQLGYIARSIVRHELDEVGVNRNGPTLNVARMQKKATGE